MPVAAGLSALPVAFTGLSALAQLGMGAASSFKTKKLNADVDKFAATDKVNQSIKDFYNSAYNRYNPNAYQSAEYNQLERQRKATEASALQGAQDRRGGLAAVSNIVQSGNVAAGRNAAQAESAQRQNLGQLGQAAGALASETNRVYGNKFNLLAQKAAQQAKKQNMYTQAGLSSLSDMGTLLYKSQSNKDVKDKDEDKGK